MTVKKPFIEQNYCDYSKLLIPILRSCVGDEYYLTGMLQPGHRMS